MIKTLTKVGNSQALMIDKTMMEMLGIDMDTPLQVEVQGGELRVRPANVGIGDERIREIFEDISSRYDKTMKRLAE